MKTLKKKLHWASFCCALDKVTMTTDNTSDITCTLFKTSCIFTLLVIKCTHVCAARAVAYTTFHNSLATASNSNHILQIFANKLTSQNRSPGNIVRVQKNVTPASVEGMRPLFGIYVEQEEHADTITAQVLGQEEAERNTSPAFLASPLPVCRDSI